MHNDKSTLSAHIACFWLALALALPLLAGCQPKPQAKPEVLLSKPIRLDIPDQEVVLEFEASPDNIENFQSYIIAIEIDNPTSKPYPFPWDAPPPALLVKAEKRINGKWHVIDVPDRYVTLSRIPEAQVPFHKKLPAWHSQEAFTNYLDANSGTFKKSRSVLGLFNRDEWVDEGRYRLNGHYRISIKTKHANENLKEMPARAIIRQAYFAGK